MKHGTHSGYSHGCRCEECTVAHRIYTRNRKRLKARASYGIAFLPETRIDATEAREHLNFLSSRGIGMQAVSRQSGIALSTVQRIKSGKRLNIYPRTADRILAVSAFLTSDGHFIDSARAKQMIEELLGAGYDSKYIAQQMGAKNGRLYMGNHIRLGRMKTLELVHRRLMADAVRRMVK